MTLELGERLFVEPDVDSNRLIICRKDGQRVEIPSGLPLNEHSLRILIPLTIAGLVEEHSRGSLSAEPRAGVDIQADLSFPIGARSPIDIAYSRARGGFVSIGETLAANMLSKVFIFDITANVAHVEPLAS